MEKLAIMGGEPVAKKPIYYGRQYVDDQDVEAVVKILTSDYLTCGPTIETLEKALCAVTGAKYAVACANGTAALHMACIAGGIGEGDEVITTPITFAASANCALYVGATPVFADICADTYNIDPAEVEKKITEKTKALIPVHFTGQSVEHDALYAIAKKHNLLYIEDAAHAIGTKYNGTPIGSLADMTCFSFHPVKTVTSGEGGAVTTNDETLYKKLLLARSHGITRDASLMQHESDEPGYYEMVNVGYNYRLTDIQAALLCSQLEKLPMFSARRKEIVRRYEEAFSQVKGLILQKEIPQSDTTRHLFILQLDPEVLSCSRKEFFNALKAENVVGQVHYIPVYRHPYYESLGYEKGLCPKAEYLYDHMMSIPLYPALTNEQVEEVITAVKKVVAYYTK